ncbi:Cna B-type domain-containing protein, partial [Streptococcus pyogenes]
GSITLHLLANGKEVATKTVTAKDNWKYEFNDLDKYSAGKEIVYTITEDQVNDYNSDVSDAKNIVNKYTPGKTSATVTK